MLFVPLYFVTGKSVVGTNTPCHHTAPSLCTKRALTKVDPHLVASLGEHRAVVAPPELAERRETRGAHPVLEVLVVLEVGQVVVRVPVGEALHPERRGHDVSGVVAGLRDVLARLARPRDVLLRPEVRRIHGGVRGLVPVDPRQVRERVCANGTFNQREHDSGRDNHAVRWHNGRTGAKTTHR